MLVGLVVGKFSPFHLGHKYLIDTAVSECQYVYVIPYSNPDLGIPQSERLLSIINHYDGRSVFVIDPKGKAPHNNDHEKIHRIFCAIEVFSYVAQLNIAFGGNFRLPNRVYTSEDYGDGFAKDLSSVFGFDVKHVCVDKDRVHFPISGTEIRNGGLDQWKVK